MDASAVKALVARELEPIAQRLGLSHWEIATSASPRETTAEGNLLRGECNRLIDYDSAHVSLNPEAFETDDDVRKTLRHELMHLIVSPFDLAWEMTKDLLKDDPKTFAMLNTAWTHATEKTIINLERMYQGLTTAQPHVKIPVVNEATTLDTKGSI